MALGATPKVTTSARESSSFPMGEDTPKARADIPSKKSNTAPSTIISTAQWYWPWNAAPVAIHPQMRLQQVMELGICRVMMFAIINCMFLNKREKRNQPLVCPQSCAMMVSLPTVFCPIFTLTSVPKGRYRSTREPNLMKPRCSSMKQESPSCT